MVLLGLTLSRLCFCFVVGLSGLGTTKVLEAEERGMLGAEDVAYVDPRVVGPSNGAGGVRCGLCKCLV